MAEYQLQNWNKLRRITSHGIFHATTCSVGGKISTMKYNSFANSRHPLNNENSPLKQWVNDDTIWIFFHPGSKPSRGYNVWIYNTSKCKSINDWNSTTILSLTMQMLCKLQCLLQWFPNRNFPLSLINESTLIPITSMNWTPRN